MQRGTVQAIPATFPETLTTPSKIAQKASLLDMLNDICVSQACAASPRHRTHGTPPHTRHTPRRTACKIQPLGQRVRLRQSAAAPRVLCVLTVRCAHCRSSGLPRPRRATSTRSSCARRTLALSAFALPDLLGSAVQRRCRGGRRRFRWLCFRHSALPPRRRHPIDEKYASMKNTIRPIARDSTATTALRRCGPQRC
jgi:hypothetical protein